MRKKNKKWDDFIKEVGRGARKNPKIVEFLQESEDEEHENFLFIAAGENVIVRGMHYPDGAFEGEDDIPLVFQTFDENVVIAAWPRNHIRKILALVEEYDESVQERGWEIILNQLLKDVESKIQEGKINGI